MIISVEQAKKLIDLKDWSDERIKMKLDAIEQTIRSYTHNNFQKRTHRKAANIVDGLLVFDSNDFFKVDDTVQISESVYSNGLYTVIEADENSIGLEKEIIDEEAVLVTKVEYPADVVECCIDLMEWTLNFGGKVGIKSETLSRHSVTYEDSTTLFMGYPVGILNGLKLHMKARF